MKEVLSEGRIGFISIGEGKRQDKVQYSVEGVFNNHLFDANPEEASNAIVTICGGDDLTLGEMVKTADAIAERMPKAEIRWGVRLIPGFTDKEEVILIATVLEWQSAVGGLSDNARVV